MPHEKTKRIRKFICGVCSFKTDHIKELQTHVEDHCCSGCGGTFQTTSDHICLVGRGINNATELIEPSTTYMKRKTFSHRGALTTYTYNYDEDFVLFADAFNLVFAELRELVSSFLDRYITIKTQLSFYITTKDNKTREIIQKVYNSTFVKILHKNYVCSVLEFQLNTIISLINLFTNEKSGITILRIDKIDLTLAGIEHNTVGTYVELPLALRNRSGLISIETKDTNNCFILSVLNQLYGHMITHDKYENIPYEKLPWRAKSEVRRKMKRPSSYSPIIKHVKENKLLEIAAFFGAVNLPLIDYFENINKVSINIHTFDSKSKKVFPTRITVHDYARHVELILLKSDKNDSFHYVLIHNPSKLFCLGNKNLRILCRFCCCMFSKKIIEKHRQECYVMNKMNISFPKQNVYSFKSFHRCMSAPFKIAADLLSCSDTSENGVVKAVGYCVLGFGPDESLLYESKYVGENAIKDFLYNLVQCAEFLLEKQRQEIILLEYDQNDVLRKNEISSCQLCHESFNHESNPSNMHHHHIINDNEKYLDPHLPNKISYLCTRCNLALKPSEHIPVFLHMATKTTMHLLLEAIKTLMVRKLQIIPRNVEGYLSLYCPGLFKTVSLENFISKDFTTVFNHYRMDPMYHKYFQQSNEQFQGSVLPSLFPHKQENMNPLEQVKMPDREFFFDIIHNRIPLQSEYDNIESYCDSIGLFNLHDYAEKHLLFRAHAINAIFQSLNFWTLKNYSISVHHELSLAGLAYSAAMFLCRENYSYLKDADLTKKLCENLIGGISYMGERHVKSNTERLGATDVDDTNRVELLCADVQSLYMYAMLKPMPISDFKFIEGDEAMSFNPLQVGEGDEISYLVCASLQYTDKCKHESSDFPFVPTREAIDGSELGDVQREIYQQSLAQHGTAPGIHHVLLTQHDKNKVLIHVEHLKFLLSRGMILKNTHYLIQFRQKAFLKPYIEHTLEIRNKTNSSLEKQLAKNMVRVEAENAQIDARHEAAVAKAAAAYNDEQKKRSAQESFVDLTKPDQDANKSGAAAEKDSDSSFDVSFGKTDSIPVYDITDDDDEDFKPTKRSRISTTSNLSEKNNSSMDSSISFDAGKSNSKLKQESQETNADGESPYFVPCEKKLAVPKIFFGTRTHKQIAQITRELRKTGYVNVRSVVLASRDHTCINSLVEKLPNKNDACRELVQNTGKTGGCMWHAGARKLASFQALNSVGLTPGYDLEDLVQVGRQFKSCPYYVTRFLIQNADIIFCPYNYMIDPSIRQSMHLELDGHVLIFDEAHNMEDAAREAASFSLKQDEHQRALQDCEKVGRCGTEPYAHSEISNFLSLLSQWMDNQSPHLREKSFNSSGKCWTGTDFLAHMNVFGLTDDKFKLAVTYFEAIKLQRDKQMEALRERGNRFFDEKPVIGQLTITTVENVLRLYIELSRDNGRYKNDFRVAMSKDTVRTRRDGNAGAFRSAQVLSLHLWCLNPAVSFEALKQMVHSIVLTSGTLSPMQSFESELGTPFPLKLEANHVIEDSQVWASVVGTGPQGGNLNGSYQNVEQLSYQDELGSIVLRTCQLMPHGVLCFLPSYRMLENLGKRWSQTGLLDRINAIKTVVMEPRSGADAFQEAMNTFYGAIQESSNSSARAIGSKTGALFLAVCRGKVSEGLDFADNNARAVICVGIPFPNFKDMQVELKREYNNQNLKRGLLNGGEWYEIQAFRALNQALGRCIQHRTDWGAILLVDDRYIRTPRYKNSLSKWIRSSVRAYPTWQALENSLTAFRDNIESKHLAPCSSSFLEIDSVEMKKNTGEGPDGSWLGMAIENGQNNSPFPKNDSTSHSIPFANSYSTSRIDGDDIGSSSETNVKSVSISDQSPSSSLFNGQRSNFNNFKLPSTPASIFADKSRRSTKNDKPGSLASMFAKQVEKGLSSPSDTSDGAQFRFNPNQISLDSSSSGSAESSSARSKRPRDKKLKL